MKKYVARMTSVLLLFTMLFLLGGCSQPTEKDKLLGTWRAEVDLTEKLNEEMGLDEEMAQYMVVDDFGFAFVVTFNEDDSCKLSLDEASMKEAMEGLKGDLRTGVEKYIGDMMAAMEIDMSLEEFMEASGMDLDAMLDELFGEEAMDELFAEMGTLNMDCFYKVQDGKIYLLENKGDAINEGEYVSYTLEEEQMIFQEVVIDGEIDKEMADMMLPMVFNKVTE